MGCWWPCCTCGDACTSGKCFIVTIPAVTDGTCGECETINIAAELQFVSGCRWSHTLATTLCGKPVTFTLEYSASVWTLSMDDGVGVNTWTMNQSDFACTGAMTFTLTNSTGVCTLPSTVTVEVATCDVCPCDIMPAQWILTMSGFTNGACSNCTALNGDITLTFVETGVCGWKSAVGAYGLCGENRFFTLSYDIANDRFILQDFAAVGVGSPYISFVSNSLPRSGGDFDCFGSNTLTGSGWGGYCTTGPSFVSIRPA